MNKVFDPREIPHLRWRSDGIGKIRLFHETCRCGKNIDDPKEYTRLLMDGWVHCPDNLKPIDPGPEETMVPGLPDKKVAEIAERVFLKKKDIPETHHKRPGRPRKGN